MRILTKKDEDLANGPRRRKELNFGGDSDLRETEGDSAHPSKCFFCLQLKTELMKFAQNVRCDLENNPLNNFSADHD